MVQYSSLVAAIAAGVSLPQVAQAAGLNTAAKAAGLKYFGSATDNPTLSDSAYIEKLSDTEDFGQITPGNSMKWDATEGTQNEFTFDGGDAIAELAEGNGQLLRCHALVWYNQLPSWVTGGTWDNATLIEVMQNHVTNVVEHYKGQCYAWDVVNEAIEDDGAWRSNVFYDTIGPSYIPLAFEAAAKADPDVKLYYNDYNIEYAGPKVDTAVEIVKLIQDSGVKIDGVGLQGHFISGQTPSRDDIKSVMSGFTDLGVEVALTEVDIRIELPTDDAKLEQQATDYSEVTLACVETENCIGFTIWDWNDAHSWVPGVFPGTGAALPWDENAQPKPAYDAILEAFNSAGNGTESATKVFDRRIRRGALGQDN